MWRIHGTFIFCQYVVSITNTLIIVISHYRFSSGGTKSVLHTDTMENFHCVVSGRKEFVIIEPHYSKAIGPEHERLGYYYVDVEK